MEPPQIPAADKRRHVSEHIFGGVQMKFKIKGKFAPLLVAVDSKTSPGRERAPGRSVKGLLRREESAGKCSAVGSPGAKSGKAN